MTPYQMARDACANFAGASDCLFGGRCRLADNKTCRYFREAVQPLVGKVARYGRVEAVYKRLQEQASRASADALTWARNGGNGTADCRCMNCINGHRQMCLARLPKTSVTQPAAPRRIVSRYCLNCHAPIYVPTSKVCSDQCRRILKRAAQRRLRETVLAGTCQMAS